MNEEQLKDTLRTFVATFGGGIAGFVAGKGWASAEQVMAIISNPAVLSIVASILAGIWGFITHSKKNAIATVNAMPEVAGVITKGTPEGVKLAEALPNAPTVVPAGTIQAVAIAKNGDK